MMPALRELWTHMSWPPITWLLATLIVYQGARLLYRWSGLHPFANPVLTSVTVIIGLLLITDTRYETYFDQVKVLHLLLGPATVALAIPLYGQVQRLRRMLIPLTLAVIVGSATSIVSAVGIGWLFGASPELLLALAPKSTTMPVAIGIAQQTGGLASLTALTVTLTGISGAIMAGGVLGLVRIRDAAVRGFVFGTAAHAIGTAQAFREGEAAGAFAALAMGLTGVATALLLPVLVLLLGVQSWTFAAH